MHDDVMSDLYATLDRYKDALKLISNHAHLDEHERGFGEASRYYGIADEALKGATVNATQ